MTIDHQTDSRSHREVGAGLPIESRRHCVIGAGLSGLAVAKALKERGIPFDVLERNDAIGGNWYDGVYDSTHIISSRDSTAYADFPMPRHYPDFPSRDQLLAYFNAYADRFGLREHVSFETEVTGVEPLDENGMAGWRVTLRSEGVASGTDVTPTERETREYAGVVVCNGHHWSKRIPEYPGEFVGKTLHSKDYKRPSDFEGRSILVVGMGNSGCDIAVEAAREGLESHISARRGTHLLPKTIFGVPTSEWDRPWMPVCAQKRLMKLLLRVTVGSNERYGLPKPEHDLFERHPTVNSQLLYELRHGRVRPKPDIERLDGRMVHFVDGTTVEADTIVWATGFNVAFPFLPDDLFEWERGYPRVVAGMIPPGKANLYAFGLGQPRGGAGPLATAGSRLLALMLDTQAELDHPLADDLARLRKPEARELFGVSELMRRIRMGDRIVRLIRWRARRASGAVVAVGRSGPGQVARSEGGGSRREVPPTEGAGEPIGSAGRRVGANVQRLGRGDGVERAVEPVGARDVEAPPEAAAGPDVLRPEPDGALRPVREGDVVDGALGSAGAPANGGPPRDRQVA
jgi:thioredoxin reductase